MTDQNKPQEQEEGDSVVEPAEDGAPLQGPSPEDVVAANAVADEDVEPSQPELVTPAPASGAAPAKDGAAATSTGKPRSRAATTAPTPPSAEAGEPPHYIDDPVSKWWVILIVAVFAVIFAWALLLGSNGLLGGGGTEPSAAPTPSPQVSPGPTASAAAPASAEVSVPATPVPTVEATAPTTPEASEQAPPDPSPAATLEVTVAPTSVPSTPEALGPPASPAG